MRVLGVDSGAGDVAFLAARHVGPDGRVLGIDRSPAAVEAASERALALGPADRVAFAVADATVLPKGPFDAVVGRLVLMFLPDPVAALRGLATRVRSGGILAFQESAISSARATFPAPVFELSRRIIGETLRASGNDPDMGLRLTALLRSAELRPVDIRGMSGVSALASLWFKAG